MNKTLTIFNSISALLCSVFLIVGCTKDDDSKANDEQNYSISMKVNGKTWSSTTTTLYTESHYDSEKGDFYLVTIGGQQIDSKNNEEMSALQLHVAIPKARLHNPKGTYPILAMSNVSVGDGTAVFNMGNEKLYASYDPRDATKVVGTIAITSFKTGNQIISGEDNLGEGYTLLSGTFKVDMYSVERNSTEMLRITDGKFNLKLGIGF